MSIRDHLEKKDFSESGLTLIECLVAIIIIALTTATITPMVVFAVATRVQNQRSEQALRLAQSEIDKVRLTVEQGGDYGARLTTMSLLADSTVTNVVDVAAPTSFIASTDTVDSVLKAKKVDSDGDGDTDFAVQLFRTTGVELPVAGGTNTPVSFDIGVRVYDARAERNLGSLSRDEASMVFTSGEGDRGTQPLAVIYSQISQGDLVGSLCQYWEAEGGNPVSSGLRCN